ncbi:MAG: hypothetical protein GX295_11705 [Syntrophomonadaceae bacterium]|nr:hypothetical protein [Syntrophomonadaceae bacterium]
MIKKIRSFLFKRRGIATAEIICIALVIIAVSATAIANVGAAQSRLANKTITQINSM